MKKKLFKSKTKEASALMVIILIFFSIFILSIASSYLIFLNIFSSNDSADSLKAYYAARTGVEQATYEALKNNYPFFALTCDNDIFGDILSNKARYRVFCQVENGINVFYSLGEYRKNQVILKIPCINLEDECHDFCLQGSLCGGGKIMDHDGYRFVLSPPDCNFAGDSCDNFFDKKDSLSYLWEKPNSYQYTGASNCCNGQNNVDILDPQNQPQFMAAKYCDDLDINGFSDWYLPAREEFYALSRSRAYNYFKIIEDRYWTSSESLDDPGRAVVISPFDQYLIEDDKETPYFVRCIRRID